ncbi:hypothetical protein SELMODRAFT_413909 [Selaginella moellendorffii]|uniref:Uncharacterized protein n=1 Tax=Selaginella moellendorffii TaxID=88036 RepID=D8RR08_SELML|nr:hypothetical protein SELMODRAFT_413909 [Selaginella moellendorffii]
MAARKALWKFCSCSREEHPDGRISLFCRKCCQAFCELDAAEHFKSCDGALEAPDRPAWIEQEKEIRKDKHRMLVRGLGEDCHCGNQHLDRPDGRGKNVFYCSSAKCDEAFCEFSVRNHAPSPPESDSAPITSSCSTRRRLHRKFAARVNASAFQRVLRSVLRVVMAGMMVGVMAIDGVDAKLLLAEASDLVALPGKISGSFFVGSNAIEFRLLGQGSIHRRNSSACESNAVEKPYANAGLNAASPQVRRLACSMFRMAIQVLCKQQQICDEESSVAKDAIEKLAKSSAGPVYRLLDCRTGFQRVVSAGSQLQRRRHRRKRYRMKTRLLCCSGHRIEAAILLVRGDTQEKLAYVSYSSAFYQGLWFSSLSSSLAHILRGTEELKRIMAQEVRGGSKKQLSANITGGNSPRI